MYTSHFDCKEETEWWICLKDDKFDINNLKSKRRNEINKGLNNCECFEIDVASCAEQLYEVYSSAFVKYKKAGSGLDKESFLKDMARREKLGENIFVGVRLKDSEKLAGYGMLRIYNDCLEMLSFKFDPEYLKYNVSFALVYYILEKYGPNEIVEGCSVVGSNRCMKYIIDGARSVRHDTNIQEFLYKYFGFRKAYAKLNLVYTKRIKICLILLKPFIKLIKKLSNKPLFNDIYSLLLLDNIKKATQHIS